MLPVARSGPLVAALVIAALVLGGAYVATLSGLLAPKGAAVLLLVSDPESAARRVQSISIPDGTLADRADIDPRFTAQSLRTFMMADGATVALASSGIVRTSVSNPDDVSLLVASAVPVPPHTPLSVWGPDAERIAWVSPADGSVQVYERNARGAYLPIFMLSDVRPSSIQFLPDGAALVVAQTRVDTTVISTVSLTGGGLRPVATVPGYAVLIPPQ